MAARKRVRLTKAALPFAKAAQKYQKEALRHVRLAQKYLRLSHHHHALAAQAKVNRDTAVERAMSHRRR